MLWKLKYFDLQLMSLGIQLFKGQWMNPQCCLCYEIQVCAIHDFAVETKTKNMTDYDNQDGEQRAK